MIGIFEETESGSAKKQRELVGNSEKSWQTFAPTLVVCSGYLAVRYMDPRSPITIRASPPKQCLGPGV